MWRFVLISFIGLGFAFYELSGGSDYAPAPNSIQVHAKLIRPVARPEPRAPDRQARTVAQIEAMMDGTDQPDEETERISASLAAASAAAASVIEAEASRPKAELLELDLTGRVGSGGTIDDAIAAALGGTVPDPARLRWIKEPMVELRGGPGLSFDAVARVTKGTEVTVLDDPGYGWLNVRVTENNQTGWLAEWLLTAPQ